MKKLLTTISLFILVIASVSAGYVGHIYPDRLEAKEGNILVTFFNHGNSKVKDLKATAYIPDLDVYHKSGDFNLRSKTSGRVYIIVEIPHDTEPDYYPVIVTLRNNDVREKTHTWLEVY